MRRVVKVSRIRIIITIIVVVLTTLLTGCTGKEPNEIAYVVALGIDSTDDDNYKITIQYANTTQISGGASESGGKAGSEIVDNVTIEAPNIYAGVGLANNIVSKSFSMSHAKLIVFSKEIAEKGVKDMIETLVRSEEIRPDVFIAVANTTANDYLTSVNPEMEVNPAQYYQLIYQKNQLVGIPDGQLREFFTGLYTDNYDSILPVSGVIEGAGGNSQNDDKGQSKDGQNEGSEESSESLDSFESKSSNEKDENEKEKDAEKNTSKYEYDIKNYIGGETAIEKKNKAEAIGAAVFEKDKMVGELGEVETEICKMLKGDYTYSYLTYYNNDTPDIPITVKTTQQKKPKYKIDTDKKTVDIELYIESDLYSLPADYNVENKIEDFERNVANYTSSTCTEFINNFTKKYNSDILKLNEKVKYKFLTNNQYNWFKKNVDWSEYKFSVCTDFKVRRTGLIVRE